MSFNEIKHEFKKKAKECRPGTEQVMWFKMAKVNPYETLVEDENDAKERDVQIKYKDIVYDDQVCSMLIIIDMTAYSKLEKERVHNKSLKITNACISHQIMTPLQTIELLCRVLICSVAERQAKIVQRVLNGAKFISFNVNNILSFQRMQHGG